MAYDIKERLFVSTIADDAVEMAYKNGVGLEIAEFCTAANMDDNFAEYDVIVRNKLEKSSRYVFHGPFNELNPSAIDPLSRKLCAFRFKQAYDTMKHYGMNKMVLHSGYIPNVYYKQWYRDRAIEFFKEYMSDKDDNFVLAIENVLEDEPYTLREVVDGIDDKRVGICFDIGHANIVSSVPIEEWTKLFQDKLYHVHIHDNMGEFDLHLPLGDGKINWQGIIDSIESSGVKPTYTIENIHCEKSFESLRKGGYIK